MTKIFDVEGKPYWRYEAKGGIGDFAGALTGIVSIYDNENTEVQARTFNPDELQDLANLAKTFEGLLTFRSSPHASMWVCEAARLVFRHANFAGMEERDATEIVKFVERNAGFEFASFPWWRGRDAGKREDGTQISCRLIRFVNHAQK